MQATVSTRVGSSCASCLIVTQWTSMIGRVDGRTVASTVAGFAGVIGLDRRDGVLRCGDAAEGVGLLLERQPLQEDRRVAGCATA